MKTLVTALTLLLGAVGAAEASEGMAEKLIKRGDRFFASRGKSERWVLKAVESYEKALAVDTKNLEASWRYARSSYWIGVYAEDSEEKARAFKRAIDLTKRAVAIDPKSVANHFWLGVSYAKYGEAKGAMSSLGLIKPIKKQMERVIALDESFAGGGAHRLLGWIYHKLPGIAGGSNEKAVEHLKKAVALDGSHLLNHLCLAEVYRQTDRLKEAKVHLELIVKAPYQEHRRPENDLEKEGAKDLLAKIAGAEKENKR